MNKEKLLYALEAMNEHNIDFYGFSETNITKRQAEIWQKQLGFHSYFSYSQQEGKGQGVGIIIRADYNIFVHKAVADKNGPFINNRWYYSLFRMLESKHYLDTLPLFNDNDEDIITYMPSDLNKQPARLDYIWASLPTISKCLDTLVIENVYFKTDHKTVTLSIDTAALIGQKTAKTNKKKKKITRTVFAYDEMDKKDHDDFKWNNFKKELDERIDQLDLKSRKITKRRHIDTIWDCFRQIITKLYIINRIQEIRSLIRKLRNVPELEMIDRWTCLQVTISKLKDKYEIFTSHNPLTFNNNFHFTLYLKELNEICKHLRHVFKIELHILEQEQIISHIKKRCVNYKDDQAKMITSITEKEMAHISIEKIYKKDHNGNESLITDESDVLRETIHHFQTIAGVNDDIYSDIMNLPSKDKWLDIIRNTPNGKAAGPSGICNEMLKHLSDDCHDVLYCLICKIIEFGNLPKQWKQATVFPIAKPKPFNCKLSNS
ncbi:hypothetical protein RclHR1_29480001 [Rhizophagus clarus]|uniref:Endonuclease/exonuclease/phosphatase domain-containing protein n=1 Tax=Rhizophagus clarus TaxID=94130 RepID=A0A2Z6RZJ4_9GLOM|nr:hypothetical protein RclHR1_29480001 [Rhizophagus clarus]